MAADESKTRRPSFSLPQPGLIGILIRLALAALVLYMGFGAIVDAPSFWDGFTDPIGSLGYIVPLAIFSSWVINELTGRNWRWFPSMWLLVGLSATMIFGMIQGEPFGPIFGFYVWVWALLFSTLLGPALLLAALLRTPGCEMRSYAHLQAFVTGRNPNERVCPGWIDRFDKVRLFGRL